MQIAAGCRRWIVSCARESCHVDRLERSIPRETGTGTTPSDLHATPAPGTGSAPPQLIRIRGEVSAVHVDMNVTVEVCFVSVVRYASATVKCTNFIDEIHGTGLGSCLVRGDGHRCSICIGSMDVHSIVSSSHQLDLQLSMQSGNKLAICVIDQNYNLQSSV